MITKLNGIEMVKLLRVHIVQYLTPMAKLHNKKKTKYRYTNKKNDE